MKNIFVLILLLVAATCTPVCSQDLQQVTVEWLKVNNGKFIIFNAYEDNGGALPKVRDIARLFIEVAPEGDNVNRPKKSNIYHNDTRRVGKLWFYALKASEPFRNKIGLEDDNIGEIRRLYGKSSGTIDNSLSAAQWRLIIPKLIEAKKPIEIGGRSVNFVEVTDEYRKAFSHEIAEINALLSEVANYRLESNIILPHLEYDRLSLEYVPSDGGDKAPPIKSKASQTDIVLDLTALSKKVKTFKVILPDDQEMRVTALSNIHPNIELVTHKGKDSVIIGGKNSTFSIQLDNLLSDRDVRMTDCIIKLKNLETGRRHQLKFSGTISKHLPVKVSEVTKHEELKENSSLIQITNNNKYPVTVGKEHVKVKSEIAKTSAVFSIYDGLRGKEFEGFTIKQQSSRNIVVALGVLNGMFVEGDKYQADFVVTDPSGKDISQPIRGVYQEVKEQLSYHKLAFKLSMLFILMVLSSIAFIRGTKFQSDRKEIKKQLLLLQTGFVIVLGSIIGAADHIPSGSNAALLIYNYSEVVAAFVFFVSACVMSARNSEIELKIGDSFALSLIILIVPFLMMNETSKMAAGWMSGLYESIASKPAFKWLLLALIACVMVRMLIKRENNGNPVAWEDLKERFKSIGSKINKSQDELGEFQGQGRGQDHGTQEKHGCRVNNLNVDEEIERFKALEPSMQESEYEKMIHIRNNFVSLIEDSLKLDMKPFLDDSGGVERDKMVPVLKKYHESSGMLNSVEEILCKVGIARDESKLLDKLEIVILEQKQNSTQLTKLYQLLEVEEERRTHDCALKKITDLKNSYKRGLKIIDEMDGEKARFISDINALIGTSEFLNMFAREHKLMGIIEKEERTFADVVEVVEMMKTEFGDMVDRNKKDIEAMADRNKKDIEAMADRNKKDIEAMADRNEKELETMAERNKKALDGERDKRRGLDALCEKLKETIEPCVDFLMLKGKNKTQIMEGRSVDFFSEHLNFFNANEACIPLYIRQFEALVAYLDLTFQEINRKIPADTTFQTFINNILGKKGYTGLAHLRAVLGENGQRDELFRLLDVKDHQDIMKIDKKVFYDNIINDILNPILDEISKLYLYSKVEHDGLNLVEAFKDGHLDVVAVNEAFCHVKASLKSQFEIEIDTPLLFQDRFNKEIHEAQNNPNIDTLFWDDKSVVKAIQTTINQLEIGTIYDVYSIGIKSPELGVDRKSKLIAKNEN